MTLDNEEYLGIIIAWLSKLFIRTWKEDVFESSWQKQRYLLTGDETAALKVQLAIAWLPRRVQSGNPGDFKPV